MAAAQVRVRRAYEEPEPNDGVRVLVDRIWPRGLGRHGSLLCQAAWLTGMAVPSARSVR